MDNHLRVMGKDLFERLSSEMTCNDISFPAKLGKAPLPRKLIERTAGCKPQDWLCVPESPCVVIVEAHDITAVERIRLMENHVHTYIKHHPDRSMVLCPIIMAFHSPAILVGSTDFPDIVSDWIFLPVAISDLARRVRSALKRKGMLKTQRGSEANCERLLSDREAQILRLSNHGMKNSNLADKLFLSETTIKWHFRNIYAKLNVNNRAAAITRARELGLL